ncbi:MAG TPA: CBS domain-containing protein [Actinomycetota bacterium]|nr:CBS domain-containing protein [Actinomycetota bacterium]
MTHRTTIRSERSELADALGTVADAMTRTVISVPPDMPASEALAYLYRSGVGGAPVVEHERVEGVVTTSDLAAPRPFARETGPFLRPHNGGSEWRVRDLMTESALTASADEPLVEAVVRMARARVDRLPVVDQDRRPVGIVARDDVVRALARVAVREEAGIESERPVLMPD